MDTGFCLNADIFSNQESLYNAHIYLERWFGTGTRTYSPISMISELDEKYRNDSDTEKFPIHSYLVPKENVNIVYANPREDIKADFDKGDHVKFVVHPQFEYREDMDEVKGYPRLPDKDVSPSSSSRTLVVIGKDYAVKVHCPVRLSRYIRSVGERTIIHALLVSRELSTVDFPLFYYMPETIGINFRSKPGKRSWGFMVREMIPRPDTGEQHLLIPCFALYSKDKYHPERKPLIVDLIEMSGMDPAEFVLTQVLFPILSCWIYALVKYGFVFESHGQNTLLKVDKNFKVVGIVHRDLDVDVHFPTRRKLGLSLDNFHPVCVIDEPTDIRPFGSMISMHYDKSMGKQFFDYLAITMEEYYSIPPTFLQDKCKDFIRENLPSYKEYFPSCVYDHAEEKITPNLWKVKVVSDNPKWRPN